MKRVRTLRMSAALTALSLTCIGGPALAAGATPVDDPGLEAPPGTGEMATSSEAPTDPQVAIEARTLATDFAEELETVYDEVFVDAAPESIEAVSQQGAMGLVDDDALSSEGAASLQELGEGIAAEATALEADPAAEVVVDEVALEHVGEVEVAQVDANTVSAVVDVEITRHIAGDDVDWVEVIPHELLIETGSGQVNEVIVHDLAYQLEHASAASDDTERLMQIPGSDDDALATQPTALSATNRQKVATYALKYAISPNTSYKLYSVDCTNFVSQAMLAGGWKEVSHPWIDYKNDDAWWYGGVPTNSWTWSGAENFYRMTKALKRTTTAKYVSDLRVGDLLQYKASGATAMTHSMVVTSKSGSNIYLSYHTNNTKNKPFSQLKGLNVSWFGHHV